MKDKKGANQSTEYVIYFFITTMLILLFIDIILAFFSVYQTHVTASSVARVISINGGYDTIEDNNIVDSYDLYAYAQKQLENRMDDPDTLIITITDKNGEHVLTASEKSDTYSVDLGEEFTVRVEEKIPFVRLANVPINITVSSTSSGVSEVYHKS